MSKSSEEIKELQRLVNRLVSLEGKIILFHDKAYLASIEKVLDPEPLLHALVQATPLSEVECVEILQHTFSLQSPPRRISTAWMATAQRDLKRLEEAPGLVALAQENVKRLKGQAIDRAWVAGFRQRLDLLRGLDLSALQASPSQVVEALHGEDAAQYVSWLLEECVQRRAAASKRAARRLELLALRLEGKPSLREEHEYNPRIEESADRARETLLLPGRSRRKRLWQLIAALYSWPDPPKRQENPAANLPISAALPVAIREIAARLIQAQPRVNHAEYRAQLSRVLFGYAVLFPPQESILLNEAQLTLLQRRYKPAKKALAQFTLSFEQVADLVSLQYEPKHKWADEQARLEQELKILGGWASEGLSTKALQEVAQRQLLGEMLTQDWSTKTAQSYCKWVLQLAPHYQQQGIKLAITPETFHQLQKAKNEELALLAQCLLAHHAVSSTRAAAQQIATLDATIALFQKLPQRFRDCLKNLDEAPPNLGQTLHPAFSAWLNDSARLDRYLHLCALLNEEQSLSHSLLEDFSRAQRRDLERQYLLSLEALTPLQQQMLARLSQPEAPLSPTRTQRRLEERLNELLQRLYRVRLDEIIAESFLRAYGLSLPKVTPAWRDIFRFYMSIEDNRDWLGLLLQKATARPGHFFVPTLPANQSWIEKAAAHFQVQAWLSPRRQVITINERPYTLLLEEDPIEVLRMGIPFDTCLSLEGGSNAASTVLNAIDINKRVIYLKDQKGSIIARQLLAISTQHHLLRYRVYCSLTKELEPLVQSHFAAFVTQLATEANLLKTNTGEPEKLHAGFWYDDGALEEDSTIEANAHIQQYCALLSLQTPTAPPQALQEEADAWFYRQKDKPEEALRAMRYWDRAPSKSASCDWIYQRLGHAACVRRCLAGEEIFLHLILSCAAQKGLPDLLLASREIIHDDGQSEALYRHIQQIPFSATALLPIIREACRISASAKVMNDHGIEHGLAYEVPNFVSQLGLQHLFQICDEVQPLWDWVAAQQEDCVICMQSAESQLIEQSPQVYLKDPDQKALLACLQDKRRSLLSRKVALRIAALFPLPQRNPVTCTPLLWFTRGIADAIGVRRVLKDLARDPRFSRSPDLLAAFLRQGGSEGDLDTLPLAERPPFEALDNLALQLDWLKPWLYKKYPSPECDPGGWYPQVWELYFHRRIATSWRKTLRREVENNEADAQRAAKLLCELGDIESLQRLQQNKELGISTRKKGATAQGFHWSWDPFLMTAEVRWQVSPTAKTFEDYLTGWHSQRLTSLDMALVVAALDFLQRTPKLFEEVSARSPTHRATEVILGANLPGWLQVYTLEWLLQQSEEDLPEPIINTFRQCVTQRSNLIKFMSPALLFRLWRYTSMQAALLTTMSKLYQSSDVQKLWDALEKEAKRQALDWTELRHRWLAAIATGRCCDELHELQPKERLLEVMRAVLRYCQPSEWLDFYGELRDALSVSWFLQELQALSAPPYQSILSALGDPSEISWDEKRMRIVWLRALCQRCLS